MAQLYAELKVPILIISVEKKENKILYRYIMICRLILKAELGFKTERKMYIKSEYYLLNIYKCTLVTLSSKDLV